ncbi:MAG: hypothetical protein S4CHLAM45_11660 [Chlamydiales bacterium]|nr:hypothetical protein [Chlamydiales bacterium]MCH9619658.1 hypothetical protein [Chlamydiales bacterium]MCH9623264.1 hypothetical protein [Chlamydiales bacterium]
MSSSQVAFPQQSFHVATSIEKGACACAIVCCLVARTILKRSSPSPILKAVALFGNVCEGGVVVGGGAYFVSKIVMLWKVGLLNLSEEFEGKDFKEIDTFRPISRSTGSLLTLTYAQKGRPHIEFFMREAVQAERARALGYELP